MSLSERGLLPGEVVRDPEGLGLAVVEVRGQPDRDQVEALLLGLRRRQPAPAVGRDEVARLILGGERDPVVVVARPDGPADGVRLEVAERDVDGDADHAALRHQHIAGRGPELEAVGTQRHRRRGDGRQREERRERGRGDDDRRETAAKAEHPGRSPR